MECPRARGHRDWDRGVGLCTCAALRDHRVNDHVLGFLRALKAVAWGFLGLRKNSEHGDDAARLTPGRLILAAVLATAVFVAVLLLIIRIVTAQV